MPGFARRSSMRIPVAVPTGALPEALESTPDSPPVEGEALIYVTTANGVSRVRLADLERVTSGATVVVNTLRHALRIHDREGIPMYKAADLLAERRIEAVRKMKAFDPQPRAGVADVLQR